MSSDRLQSLLEKFFAGACTDEEQQELALWIDALGNEDEWQARLKNIWEHTAGGEMMDPSAAEGILRNVMDAETQRPADHVRPKPLIGGLYKLSVAAAAVIGLLMALSIIYVNKNFRPAAQTEPTDLSHIKNDIAPGGNRAVLVLANGQKILLDSARSGALAQLGSVRVSKLDGGRLAFQQQAAGGDRPQNDSAALSWNTLRTPPGGQYQITLPDGSKAWLNAASSIKFPSAFGSGERQVEITGEVFFEIAKNARQPFVVDITPGGGMPGGRIRVLGTAFNVHAYADEATLRTTLIEGKVEMEDTDGKSRVTLSPGQQAALNSDGSIAVQKDVNTGEAVAWKNGLFDFEGIGIRYVMQEIARWYNVDVKYENTTSAHFMGTISRDVDLSEVLKMLEMTGAVHFRIEGRTITVMKDKR